MVYAGIIALIFIGELFIKNHVEKNRKDGEEGDTAGQDIVEKISQ